MLEQWIVGLLGPHIAFMVGMLVFITMIFGLFIAIGCFIDYRERK